MDPESIMPPDPKNCCSGPCRETAVFTIRYAVDRQRRKLAAMEHLLKIAERLEPGSPLEEFLAELSWRPDFRG